MIMRYLNGYVDRSEVVLLRDDGGTLVEDRVPARHVAYFRTSDLRENPLDIIGLLRDDPAVRVLQEQGNWLSITWECGYWDGARPNPHRGGKLGMWVSYREERCRQLETFGVRSYEADVSPLRRHLSDTELEIGRPRRVYLDIETDSRKSFDEAKNGHARILTWALVDTDGCVKTGCLPDEDDVLEASMLCDLWEALRPYHQIVAWNGGGPSSRDGGFDFPVLRTRSRRLNVQVEFRRWLYLDQMLAYKRYNSVSAESGAEKQSYALQNIATGLLGEGKHPVDGSKAYEYWAAGGDKREELIRYNIQDTDLLRRIEEKTGYLELYQTLCEVCHVFPDTGGLKPTRQVDAYMLRLGYQKNHHFPTKWYDENSAPPPPFRGAFVMEPRCNGIETDVHVCDFASLYPSIMITWNLSPETKLRHLEDGTRAEGECLAPSTGLITDTTKQGILSYALTELLELRKSWKKKRSQCAPGTPEAKDAERRTNAYKVAANSFYGVMGNIHGRFYDRDISETTTQQGVWLLKRTIVEAEMNGWRAIYGDTDSVFVTGPTAEEFSAFVDRCNTVLFPKLLSDLGCRTNRISLSYEKQFARLVMTAAKRYVGCFTHYEGNAATSESKPEVKGLEYKRGDTNRLAREMQAEVINTFRRGVVDPLVYAVIVRTYKSMTLADELDLSKVASSKAISRDLRAYTPRPRKDGQISELAHVKLAKAAQQRGEEVAVGTRISYVVVDAATSPMTVIPAASYTGECDRYYLWENLIYPPTKRLLEAMFPRHDWEVHASARPSRRYNPDQLTLFGES